MPHFAGILGVNRHVQGWTRYAIESKVAGLASCLDERMRRIVAMYQEHGRCTGTVATAEYSPVWFD